MSTFVAKIVEHPHRLPRDERLERKASRAYYRMFKSIAVGDDEAGRRAERWLLAWEKLLPPDKRRYPVEEIS